MGAIIKNNVRIFVGFFIISIFVLVFYIAFAGQAGSNLSKDALIPDDVLLKEAELFRTKKLPDFRILDIETGRDISEEIRHGEVFLIYAITTCDACKKELKFLSSEIATRDIATKIIVIMPEEIETVKRFAVQNELKLPMASDREGKLLQELGIRYFPSNFRLIEGDIKDVTFGFSKSTSDFLKQAEIN